MSGFRRIALTALLLVLTLSAPAAAQAPPPDKINIQTFDAAVGKNVYVTQHGAAVAPHLGYGVGLLLNYQRNPFSIYNVDASGNRGDIQTSVIKDFFAAELYGFLGLANHISLGLSMPLALYMTGTETTDLGEPLPGGGLSAFAWGDLALHIKGHLYTLKKVGLSFGAQLSITAPTGRFAEHFIGDELPTFRPRVIAEFRHRLLSAAVNLGGVFRIKESAFYNDNFRLGQQFTYGVAVAVKPTDSPVANDWPSDGAVMVTAGRAFTVRVRSSNWPRVMATPPGCRTSPTSTSRVSTTPSIAARTTNFSICTSIRSRLAWACARAVSAVATALSACMTLA